MDQAKLDRYQKESIEYRSLIEPLGGEGMEAWATAKMGELHELPDEAWLADHPELSAYIEIMGEAIMRSCVVVKEEIDQGIIPEYHPSQGIAQMSMILFMEGWKARGADQLRELVEELNDAR